MEALRGNIFLNPDEITLIASGRTSDESYVPQNEAANVRAEVERCRKVLADDFLDLIHTGAVTPECIGKIHSRLIAITELRDQLRAAIIESSDVPGEAAELLRKQTEENRYDSY